MNLWTSCTHAQVMSMKRTVVWSSTRHTVHWWARSGRYFLASAPGQLTFPRLVCTSSDSFFSMFCLLSTYAYLVPHHNCLNWHFFFLQLRSYVTLLPRSYESLSISVPSTKNFLSILSLRNTIVSVWSLFSNNPYYCQSLFDQFTDCY